MASPGWSLTGSFAQGVNWFCWLLMAHVYPPPSTDVWKPKEGLAMTLIHGAGVHCPSPRMVTYSAPSAAKPPKPLKNSSFGGGEAASGIGVQDRRLGGGTKAAGDSSRRLTCWK